MRTLIFLFLVLTGVVRAQNLTDANGRKQGVWAKVYPGTKVYQYKGQFKDDKPVGTFTYYYQSSKLKAIVKHIEGTNRSEAVYYHENGLVMSKGIYKDLKKDSIWLNFGPSGRLSNKETYKNDLLDGKKIVFYVPEDIEDKSQLVMSVSFYKEGKMNGEYVEYFEGGSLKVKGAYVMDRKSGLWVSYDVGGFKMTEETFRNGLKHGWCMAFDESGKVVGKQYYLDGRHIQGKELETRLNQIKHNSSKPKN
jgi:antitoxin component YwqK of YwqJK toxin-antitoxin module